jgi:hypothetical protein
VRQREVDVAVGVMKRPPQGCWGRKLLQLPSAVFATKDAGLGLCLMPRLLASRHPGLVEVKDYAHLMAPLERTVWLLTHPDQRKTPRVVALMNALTEAFVEPASHR